LNSTTIPHPILLLTIRKVIKKIHAILSFWLGTCKY
jgi:hypothetical protein